MDEININYEYQITKKIYEKYNTIILVELNKMILGYIETIIRILQNKDKDEKYILEFFTNNLFKDIQEDYGHIKSVELLSKINNIAEI